MYTLESSNALRAPLILTISPPRTLQLDTPIIPHTPHVTVSNPFEPKCMPDALCPLVFTASIFHSHDLN